MKYIVYLIIYYYLIINVNCEVDCSQFNGNCFKCEMEKGCGYCGSTNKCINGNLNGPSNPILCNIIDWNPCQKRCESQKYCSDCIAAGCGWCETYPPSCNLGNITNSYKKNCHIDSWVFGDLSSCEIHPDCSRYKDCMECSEDERCGWCRSSSMCIYGNNAGPFKEECEAWSYIYCPIATVDVWWTWTMIGIILGIFLTITIMAIIRRVKQKKREMINTDLSEDDSLIMNRF